MSGAVQGSLLQQSRQLYHLKSLPFALISVMVFPANRPVLSSCQVGQVRSKGGGLYGAVGAVRLCHVPWQSVRASPQQTLAGGMMVCRLLGSAALAGCWEGSDVLGRECQGRVIPGTGPSLGISGLFSTCLHTPELLACSAAVQAAPPAPAPGCSPQHSAAKSNPQPRPSLRATAKPRNTPITATCARRRLH